MGQNGIRIDSTQLERLSTDLAAMPRELHTSIKATIKAGTLDSLRHTIPKYYALRPKRLSGTFRVTSRSVKKGDEYSLQYEVLGRRLTMAHFNVTPFEAIRRNTPLIEVIKGSIQRASPRPDSEGKMRSPFVMKIKSGKPDGFDKNVFVMSGGKTSNKRPKLYSYRTVSVPQMIENENVSEETQTTMLERFENSLFGIIEKQMDIMQQNILRG